MKMGRQAACVAALLATTPLALSAQLAVATQDVNLRPSHSIHDPSIRAITKGDTLALLAPDTANGFVHVETRPDGTAGWVYSRYVAIVAAPRAAAPPAPPSTALAPAPAPVVLVTTAPESYHGCPSVGVNRSGNAPALPIQALNLLKNRYTAPTPAELDSSIRLASFLAPGDDVRRFDARRGAEIVGVVTDVRVGGQETTNCEATAPKYRDTHIRIALTADAPENQRVVVEVTPRWRAAMAAAGLDWSTATLATTIVGRTVRIGGWMLFDTEHARESENTRPGNPGNWRATAWEIHPVTLLEVLPR
jgi:hypothetical protein